MTKTFADLMREARATIARGVPGEAELLVERGARLVDVRETTEWEEGHIPGAVHISKSYLEQQIEAAVARPRHARWSSTARAASARCSRPRRCARWATPTSRR